MTAALAEYQYIHIQSELRINGRLSSTVSFDCTMRLVKVRYSINVVRCLAVRPSIIAVALMFCGCIGWVT